MNLEQKVKVDLSLGTALGLVILCLAPASAQEDPGATEASEAASSGKIIVTAQRREQEVSDVPQPVQAVNDESLKDLGVEQFQDVIRLVPSASVG